MSKKHKKEVTRYHPNPKIIQYVDSTLQLYESMENCKKAGKEPPTEDRRLENRLRKTKSDIIKKTFQSMADILYLFEAIAKNPRLQELFEDDLKEIFGIREHPLDWDADTNKTVFGRLLAAVLMGYLSKTTPQRDYRLKLAHIAQMAIFEKVVETLKLQLGEGAAVDTIIADLTRAVAWSQYAAKIVENDDTPSHRMIS